MLSGIPRQWRSASLATVVHRFSTNRFPLATNSTMMRITHLRCSPAAPAASSLEFLLRECPFDLVLTLDEASHAALASLDTRHLVSQPAAIEWQGKLISCFKFPSSVSFLDLKSLPVVKKQIVEPILLRLGEDSRLLLVSSTSDDFSAEGMVVSLCLAHPLFPYYERVPSSTFLWDLTVRKSSPTRTDFTWQWQSPPEEQQPLSGPALEGRISEYLKEFSIQAEFLLGETGSLFLRRMIFAIVKERKYRKGLQSFRESILSQLVDEHQPIGDQPAKKRQRLLDPVEHKEARPLPSAEEGLSVMEFFSGIGGMRLSLPTTIAGLPVKQLVAFDINTVANELYEFNFHARRLDQIARSSLRTSVVEALKPADVDGKSDIWTMSPPCQPFTTTRGAHRKDHLDNRSKGFYHLMSLLLRMRQVPRWLVLENVKGFVGSEMHELWLRVVAACGYRFQEFLLSPDELLGIPNARRRYYFVARWEPSDPSRPAPSSDGLRELLRPSSPPMPVDGENGSDDSDVEEEADDFEVDARPPENSRILTDLPARVKERFALSLGGAPVPLAELLAGRLSADEWRSWNGRADLLVPEKILAASWARKHLSVVSLDAARTYCFTKGYGKLFDHSAGSCLFLPADSRLSLAGRGRAEEAAAWEAYRREYAALDRDNLAAHFGRIRLFHPRELLALFGFPDGYSFPETAAGAPGDGPSLALLRQFGCVGNSINVAVVRTVMAFLFEEF